MKFIDWLHKNADEAVEAVSWPFRRKSIKRSFESLVDKAESKKLDVETALIEMRKNLTKTKEEGEQREIIKQIANLRIELESSVHVAELIAEEEKKMFEEEAPKEEEKKFDFR